MGPSGRNVSYRDNSRFSPDGVKSRGAIRGRRRTHGELGEEPLNVKEGDVKHEGKKENDKQDLSTFEKGQGKRFSTKLLDRGENHVSTIENRNRQQVEDRQVDVDEDDEPKEFFESYPGEDAQVVDDSHGAAHVAQFNVGFWTEEPG